MPLSGAGCPGMDGGRKSLETSCRSSQEGFPGALALLRGGQKRMCRCLLLFGGSS